MGTTAEELRTEIAQQREDLGRDFEMIGDKVSPARIVERRTEKAKGRLRSVRDSVMGSAEDLTSSTRQHVGSALGSAGHAGSTVGEAPHAMAAGARGNPLAAGLVAFGIGLLAGSVLPSTRNERQMARRLQPELEQVGRAAADIGHEMAGDLAPAVQEAGSNLGSTAKEVATDVRETVQEHAQDAKEESPTGSTGSIGSTGGR